MKNNELKRGLEARHIQMIALGGTIGVGLFMGSASTINGQVYRSCLRMPW